MAGAEGGADQFVCQRKIKARVEYEAQVHGPGTFILSAKECLSKLHVQDANFLVCIYNIGPLLTVIY